MRGLRRQPKMTSFGGGQRDADTRKGWFLSNNTHVKDLTPDATFVHIGRGNVTVKLVREILEHCPDLKTLRIIPSSMDKILSGVIRVLQDRDVILTCGREFDHSYYDSHAVVSPLYRKGRAAMNRLTEDQKKFIEEARDYGIEEAEWLFAYCGRSFVPIEALAKQFDYAYCRVYRGVLAMMQCLVPELGVSKEVASKAQGIQCKIRRIREMLVQKEYRERIGIPETLPRYRWPLFELVKSRINGTTLQEIGARSARSLDIFTKHLALGTEFVALKELGETWGISRERARQIFSRVLESLGIPEEDGV